jgi:NAD(P)-dependent dehydrogenase (short-subunit alcohol dehydrogenase family)
MAARNLDKAEAARVDILTEIPDASLEVRRLDLATLESVAGFAADVVAVHPVVDILVNNAGVMGIPRMETSDGFEMQFGTNHLGHFALTAQLMPALLRSESARVVTVTSTGRLFGGTVDPADPHFTQGYEPWQAYGRAKRANFHFAIALNRRLQFAGAPVESLVAHPGYSNTDLQSTSSRISGGGRSQRFFAATVQWVGMDPARGALSQLRAATDPAAKGGEFYGPRWVNNGSPVRKPYLDRSAKPEDLESLWSISQAETGLVLDIPELTKEVTGR